MWSNWDEYLVALSIISFMIFLVMIYCERLDKQVKEIRNQIDKYFKSIKH